MKQKRHQLRKRSEPTDFTIHAEAPTYDFIKNESCILYPEVTQGPYWYPPSELLQRDIVQDQVGVRSLALNQEGWNRPCHVCRLNVSRSSIMAGTTGR